MTGRRSDESTDRIPPQRSTDAEDLDHLPQRERGVVQDGPGTELNTEGDRLLSDSGDYQSDDRSDV
ncbi:hypothetical protein [Deinococcus hohokamensis]|uniref:MatE family transporter n=1 Tax=Deinococcus hohokamensis TaxID=309883 RepID=A0ABV9I507_9DEIO